MFRKSGSFCIFSFDITGPGVAGHWPNGMQVAPKRYLSALFGTILAVTLLIAAINAVIDPFGALGTNTVGLFFSSEREVKWSLVDDHPHDALILGSSKTTYIEPRDFSDYRFFNASFSSGVPEEFREYLEQHGDGVRMVLLGLDFFYVQSTPVSEVRRGAGHRRSVQAGVPARH